MRPLRAHPHLYELNARIYLERMRSRLGPELSLAGIPGAEWAALAERGFDAVWVMGAWKRSSGARRVALEHPEQRRVYDATLPGWSDADVDGSPYAVHAYALSPDLGAPADLGRLRDALHAHGMRLILDFVPNHLALDHPWTTAHPQRLVRGDEALRAAHPEWFYAPRPGAFFAHGRDPNFAPWVDTVQVNFFAPELRRAHLETLLDIATVADGVRCDMAMLGLNEVFGRVWGARVDGHPAPATEFWSDVIAGVRQRFPDFVFLAEAYWNSEATLLDLGFDFVYDKTLYDRLRWGSADDVRAHLETFAGGERGARFIENHDEPRALEVFGRERGLAAAAVMLTLPGMRLVHDGQCDGRRVRLPVQLVREPEEPLDEDLRRAYDPLLRRTRAPLFHEGTWEKLETRSAGDESFRDLLAWSWRLGEAQAVIVINFSANPARGLVVLQHEQRCVELDAWQVQINEDSAES